jgi:hypothetical protein
MTAVIREKMAAVRVYMKTLVKTAELVNNMLDEGHTEAAKMLQGQFCENFDDAVGCMNDIFQACREEDGDGSEGEDDIEPKMKVEDYGSPKKKPTLKPMAKKGINKSE